MAVDRPKITLHTVELSPRSVSYVIQIAEKVQFIGAYGIQTTDRWLRAELTSALH